MDIDHHFHLLKDDKVRFPKTLHSVVSAT